MNFEAVVETGTFHGTTTLFLRDISRLPVYTVEKVPRYFYYAKQRLRGKGVHCEAGDSRIFLKRLARSPQVSSSSVFFYLDAHWDEDLPLREELQIISQSWPDPVVMIDDFEVPDDPAYGYDDYGAGMRLDVSYLPQEFRRDFSLFWPGIRGDDESGRRRGCVVAARRGRTADKLSTLPVLRMGNSVGNPTQ